MPIPRLTLTAVQAMTSAALTVEQVAAFTGLDRRSVTRAMDRGEIPCVRFGGRILIPRLPLLALFVNTSTTLA